MSATSAVEAEGQRRKTGNYIKQLRTGKHETQDELAEALGVHRSAVCQWEKGRTMPSTRNLRELANHYGVSFESLLDGLPTEMEDPFMASLTKSAIAMAGALDAAYKTMQKTECPQIGGENNGEHRTHDR